MTNEHQEPASENAVPEPRPADGTADGSVDSPRADSGTEPTDAGYLFCLCCGVPMAGHSECPRCGFPRTKQCFYA